MKKFFKRIFLKRMPEADLNKEASSAATFYLKKNPLAPSIEKHNMLNYTAHGFYMGARWYEKQLGAKRGKDI